MLLFVVAMCHWSACLFWASRCRAGDVFKQYIKKKIYIHRFRSSLHIVLHEASRLWKKDLLWTAQHTQVDSTDRSIDRSIDRVDSNQKNTIGTHRMRLAESE